MELEEFYEVNGDINRAHEGSIMEAKLYGFYCLLRNTLDFHFTNPGK